MSGTAGLTGAAGAARRRPSVARLLPSPEMLNLLVGVVSATAINLLTSAAFDQGGQPGHLIISGSCMLVGALILGWLAVWLTHTRDDTLANLPTSISLPERRALLRDAINTRARSITAWVAVAVGLLVASVLVLVF